MLGFLPNWACGKRASTAGLIWLVVASAVASAIGAYYYLRIVFLMYFGPKGMTVWTRVKAACCPGVVVAAAVIMVGWHC